MIASSECYTKVRSGAKYGYTERYTMMKPGYVAVRVDATGLRLPSSESSDRTGSHRMGQRTGLLTYGP